MGNPALSIAGIGTALANCKRKFRPRRLPYLPSEPGDDAAEGIPRHLRCPQRLGRQGFATWEKRARYRIGIPQRGDGQRAGGNRFFGPAPAAEW